MLSKLRSDKIHDLLLAIPKRSGVISLIPSLFIRDSLQRIRQASTDILIRRYTLVQRRSLVRQEILRMWFLQSISPDPLL
jgi:hypothetical protein